MTIAQNLPRNTGNTDSDKDKDKEEKEQNKDKDKEKDKSKESDNKSTQSNNTESKDSNTSKQSFFLPFLLSFLDLKIEDSYARIIQLANGVFLLSLVAFFCLLNVFFYSIVLLLIKQASYETKYPRLL
jgi:negative regulator of genetic competence, sporulation and motility